MKSTVFRIRSTLPYLAALCFLAGSSWLPARPGEVIPSPQLPVFEGSGYIAASAMQPDGGMFIAGSFWSVDGIPVKGLARLKPDGTLDRTFTTELGIASTGAFFGWDIDKYDLRRSLPDTYLLALPDGKALG
jgi:hypothetical protein